MFFKPQKLIEILSLEYQNLLLWTPVLLAIGCYFSIINFEQISFSEIIFATIFFALSSTLFFLNRHLYRSLIFAFLSIILCGFLASFFYQKIHNNHNQITGKIFVDVKGRIIAINKFTNPINGSQGFSLIVGDLTLYKAEVKTTNLLSKKHNINYLRNNYTNLKNFQEIDEEFVREFNNYQNVEWVEKNNKLIYPKPPKKILVSTKFLDENIKIGDEIFFRSLLEPTKSKQFIDDFDFALDAKAKDIGAHGIIHKQIFILKQYTSTSFEIFIEKLRKKIEEKILNTLPNESGNIAAALLMGNQNLISPNVMQQIRTSGLAHLISISGLHLSLAAGIFFVTIRYLLSFSQYLTLNYDIKKISAIIAIFSSYCYLLISGSPSPAQRSFIAVLLVMMAILFDKKINQLRSISFAATFLILYNPYNIFSISFQLSFLAILILVVANQLFRQFIAKDLDNNSRLKKIFFYFFEMSLISFATQIATLPILIYYFNDIALYGSLSNMAAIPLSSFTTMPLGFASFFLMPFNLEKLALIPMGITIDWIIEIAKHVSLLPYSHIYLPQMPKIFVLIAIWGLLIFCLTSNRLKPIGIIIFFSSFISLFFINPPDLIIDDKAKFFALYNKEDGLFFSKNIKEGRKINLWMKKMNEKEFKTIDDYFFTNPNKGKIFCNEQSCEMIYKNKAILFLLRRNHIDEICNYQFDMIVNLTKKYQLPSCIDKTTISVIDNEDLLKKGIHFIFFEKNKIEFKTTK